MEDTTTLETLTLTLHGDVFADLARVIVAAATDDARPLPVGVRVRRVNGVLTFAATDNYRFAMATVQDPGDDYETVIPARFIKDVTTLIKRIGLKSRRGVVSSNTQVTLTISGRDVRADVTGPVDSVSVTGRMIDGTYPSIDHLIPNAPVATECVAFNPKFLADAGDIVTTCDGNRATAHLRVELGGDTKASLFRASCDRHAVELIYLLMPVRVR